MKRLRKRLIVWLFDHSQRLYTNWFKHHSGWQVNRDDLLQFPEGTLGNALGAFLLHNQFQLIPKVERHDAYHVLTGYGTQVEDEIALQYLCFGNGKRSPYLLGAIVLGTLLLPDHLKFYIKSYRMGKASHPFHQLDYEKLLGVPLDQLRSVFFGSRPLPNIKNLSII
nr:Coq4 family protein [Allomuricauda sp.]